MNSRSSAVRFAGSVLFGALLAACTSTGSFTGRLIDPVTNQPRPNTKVMAKAKSGGDPMCQSFDATTGADGTFTFPATCAEHTYSLASFDETLILQGDLKFDGGVVVEGTRDVQAWRANKAEGVYIVSGDTVTEVRKSSDVYWEPVFPDPKDPKTYDKARYAAVMPNSVPNVPKGAQLVISGEDNLKELVVVPMVHATSDVTFPHLESGNTYTLSDAWFLGVSFKAKKISGPADVEKVEAQTDAAKVHDLTGKGWAVRIIESEALPAGRYGIAGPDSSRMYIVDVGGDAPAPGAAPAEAAPAAPAGDAPAAPAGDAKPAGG